MRHAYLRGCRRNRAKGGWKRQMELGHGKPYHHFALNGRGYLLRELNEFIREAGRPGECWRQDRADGLYWPVNGLPRALPGFGGQKPSCKVQCGHKITI